MVEPERPSNNQSQSNEKAELIYKYSRSVYDAEFDRYRKLEDKASRYLSLISVFIVAFTFLLRFSSGSFFPPSDKLDWITCVISGLTFLTFIYVLYNLLKSQKISELPGLTSAKTLLSQLETKDLHKVQLMLTNRWDEDTHELRDTNTKKSALLSKAFYWMSWAMMMFVLSLCFILINSY